MNEIKHAFAATIIRSINKQTCQDYPNSDYRKVKYENHEGLALIIQTEKDIFLQWHPLQQDLNESEKVDLNKGIATTSISKMTIENDLLIIESANSFYYLSLDLTKDVDEILNNMVIKIYCV